MPPKRNAATAATTPMTNAQIKALIAQGVVDALAERDADRSRNGDDSHDSGSDGRRRMPVARECTYSNFLKCQPLNFKGTEGVVYLTWDCFDVVKGTDVESYTQRFQELALLCGRMFPEESDKVEKHNVAHAYTAGPGEKKPYGGSKPLCPKCNYHHKGPCAPRCNKCKKVVNLSRDCRGAAVNTNTQRGVTCYECGVQGHYKKDFPKLRNKNQGNQAENGNIVAKAYAVGTTGTNPNSNVVTGTFLLNNSYALILFDTGADRSFVSTTFSSLIDIVLTTLDHGYDVIIGMDCLTKYHALKDETLVVGSGKPNVSQ
ncbi:putative reverse transcriptase domain-containing protein [Tanacetum coccineum]|uniref:Reverse transcriptase domain-containing protein n=1 Tax=Tanacetum coccineum TaxID=301880 RepID=A0ABQ5DTH0_9ASTR